MRTSSSVRALTPAKPKPYTDLRAALDSIGRERDWFAEGCVEGTPLVVLAGAEKKGKSWILAQLVVATIVGGSWLGAFPIRKPGPVVVLDGEYGAHEYARRLARIARAEGHDPREVLGQVRYHYGQLSLHGDDETFLEIARDIDAQKAAAIVLDPLRNFLVGDENSAKDIIENLRILSVLRDAGRCPLLAAHHLNRAGSMSGSRALKTRPDLFIEGDDADEPRYTTIGRTLRRSDRIRHPFVVAFQHEHDDDDTVARTFVRARFEGEQTARGHLSKTALRVLDALRDHPEGASSNMLRKATRTNSKVMAGALAELLDAGLAEKRGERWSEATSAFLANLNPPSKEADDAPDPAF